MLSSFLSTPFPREWLENVEEGAGTLNAIILMKKLDSNFTNSPQFRFVQVCKVKLWSDWFFFDWVSFPWQQINQSINKVDLMVNPPRKGDVSYEEYNKEMTGIYGTFASYF